MADDPQNYHSGATTGGAGNAFLATGAEMAAVLPSNAANTLGTSHPPVQTNSGGGTEPEAEPGGPRAATRAAAQATATQALTGVYTGVVQAAVNQQALSDAAALVADGQVAEAVALLLQLVTGALPPAVLEQLEPWLP